MTPEEIIERYYGPKIPAGRPVDIPVQVDNLANLIGLVGFVIKQARNEALDDAIKICHEGCRTTQLSEGVMVTSTGVDSIELAEQIRKLKS